MKNKLLLLLLTSFLSAQDTQIPTANYNTQSPETALLYVLIPTVVNLIFYERPYDYNKLQAKEIKKFEFTLPTTFPYANLAAK